jgi:AcrR family transcriptional regulator
MVRQKQTEATEEAPGRRERKRAETLEKLFNAALELFAKRGFTDTRVEEITEKADVAKGTFFNYFPSKEHILMHFAGRQIGKIERCLESAREGRESMATLLRSLAKELMTLPGRTPQLARSMMSSFLSNEDVRKVIHENMAIRGRKLLAEILVVGQKRGEIRDDLPALSMAKSFQQGLFGTALLWSLDPVEPLSKAIDEMLDVMLAGMISPTRGRKSE